MHPARSGRLALFRPGGPVGVPEEKSGTVELNEHQLGKAGGRSV